MEHHMPTKAGGSLRAKSYGWQNARPVNILTPETRCSILLPKHDTRLSTLSEDRSNGERRRLLYAVAEKHCSPVDGLKSISLSRPRTKSSLQRPLKDRVERNTRHLWDGVPHAGRVEKARRKDTRVRTSISPQELMLDEESSEEPVRVELSQDSRQKPYFSQTPLISPRPRERWNLSNRPPASSQWSRPPTPPGSRQPIQQFPPGVPPPSVPLPGVLPSLPSFDPYYHDDPASAPRRRSAIACKWCRKNKRRCSGYDTGPDGRCQNCTRFNQQCLFDPLSAPPPFVPAPAPTEKAGAVSLQNSGAEFRAVHQQQMIAQQQQMMAYQHQSIADRQQLAADQLRKQYPDATPGQIEQMMQHSIAQEQMQRLLGRQIHANASGDAKPRASASPSLRTLLS